MGPSKRALVRLSGRVRPRVRAVRTERRFPFVARTSGSHSSSSRELTIVCVAALYFLKCGDSKCDLYARVVAFAISQPEDVDVNEILFRPMRQKL